jgi:hypothetical protein
MPPVTRMTRAEIAMIFNTGFLFLGVLVLVLIMLNYLSSDEEILTG